MPQSIGTAPFTPPSTASAAHVAASENANADLRVTLRAVEQKIGHRDDDASTKTIRGHVRAHFEANRTPVRWWDIPGHIRRSRHERTHDQAVLVMSISPTDGLYVGRRGLLYGSESSNFFQLTDKVPEKALKHAAGADQGAAFTAKLDAALHALAGKIEAGQSPKIVEASYKPYVV